MTPLVPYPIISNAIFYIYLLTMPIVLMNLLVRVRIVRGEGEGSYDPTGPLPYRLQRIFVHLLADHADCAHGPTGKSQDCMSGRGGEGSYDPTGHLTTPMFSSTFSYCLCRLFFWLTRRGNISVIYWPFIGREKSPGWLLIQQSPIFLHNLAVVFPDLHLVSKR